MKTARAKTVYTDMGQWAEIRRQVLVEGKSKRSVCQQHNIHWDMLKKILDTVDLRGIVWPSPAHD